jgi:hypothetical protein
VSAGVNVTPSLGVPAPGDVVGAVQENIPLTEADPPVNVDDDSAWPYVMALAVGHTEMLGVIGV